MNVIPFWNNNLLIYWAIFCSGIILNAKSLFYRWLNNVCCSVDGVVRTAMASLSSRCKNRPFFFLRVACRPH